MTYGQMSNLTLRVLGCGDAFGSGGRLQTCFHLALTGSQVLIDCGATAMTGLRRASLDPSAIDAILITHLHGDHFGGLPFLLLQQHYVGKRTRPLTIAGPAGTDARLRAALAAFFPGSEQLRWRFPLTFVELAPGTPTSLLDLNVLPLAVVHPSGAPSLGFRITTGGRTLAFSGDTEWTEALPALARDADLFVCECYAVEPGVRYHLDHATILSRSKDLGAKRLLLTHLSEAALAARERIDAEIAEDGLVVRL